MLIKIEDIYKATCDECGETVVTLLPEDFLRDTNGGVLNHFKVHSRIGFLTGLRELGWDAPSRHDADISCFKCADK